MSMNQIPLVIIWLKKDNFFFEMSLYKNPQQLQRQQVGGFNDPCVNL